MTTCAVITGAASGIGRAVAEALAADGYRVVIADRNQEQGTAVAVALNGLFVAADLCQRNECRNLIEAATEFAGGVDILVNNAGFQHVAALADFPEDTFEQMQALMLTAPFLLSKYVWPHMQEQGWGRIINIASIHGLVASANKSGYIAAKHGLLGLTKTAALEGGAHGITVNALCPAYVQTPLVEEQITAQAKAHGIAEDEVIEQIMLKNAAIKKMIPPQDIAALVRLLISEHGASITGASWTIDGGWTAQ